MARVALPILALLAALARQAAGLSLGVETDLNPTGLINHAVSMQRCGSVETDVSGRIDEHGRPQSMTPAPMDKNGWPTTDAKCVIFDNRPYAIWTGHVDDPERKQPREYGPFHMKLTGYVGEMYAGGNTSNIKITNMRYDPATNTQTAVITFLPEAEDLMVLNFKKTRRLPGGKENSGFTDLTIFFPGYSSHSQGLFTNNFTEALAPFHRMRFMDWVGTNYNPYHNPGKGPDGTFTWQERALPTHAFFGNTDLCAGCHGKPWEWVILLANQVKKDVWINIPVSASGAHFGNSTAEQSYVRQLALLFRDGNEYTNHVGLDPSLHIFIEHSNEVWNFGFHQYAYNKQVATDTVKAWPNSPLNASHPEAWNKVTPDTWAQRRHIQRLWNISQEFFEVFNDRSPPLKKPTQRIRPIYAWWFNEGLGLPTVNYTLLWHQETYGVAPDSWLYGFSAAHYFANHACKTGGVEECLEEYRKGEVASFPLTKMFAELQEQFGIHYTAYEAGPGWLVGSTDNMANHIETHRQAAMEDIVVSDVTNFLRLGGKEYNLFSLATPYNRFGCWGLTDDLYNLTTPKMAAVCKLTGSRARFCP